MHIAVRKFVKFGKVIDALAFMRCMWLSMAVLCNFQYQMDQTSAESVKAAVDRVAVTYGRIDVLYLNAGRY